MATNLESLKDFIHLLSKFDITYNIPAPYTKLIFKCTEVELSLILDYAPDDIDICFKTRGIYYINIDKVDNVKELYE